jgi:hypothetical protein
MDNLRGPALVLFSFALSGCVSSITGSTYSDGRFWYSNVKSASDIAGGPRHDLIVIVDPATGKHVETYISHGVGTLQSTASSLGPAIATALGQAGASALVRPSRNTTNVSMDVSGTGGAGTTSSSGITSSVSGTSATATGGAGTGGAGGPGGTGGTGGTATTTVNTNGSNTGGPNIPPGQVNQITQ